jgi:hypothetical protein
MGGGTVDKYGNAGHIHWGGSIIEMVDLLDEKRQKGIRQFNTDLKNIYELGCSDPRQIPLSKLVKNETYGNEYGVKFAIISILTMFIQKQTIDIETLNKYLSNSVIPLHQPNVIRALRESGILVFEDQKFEKINIKRLHEIVCTE